MTTNFHRTAAWLHACGKRKGDPWNASTQIFCMLEEISELIETFRVNQDGWEKVRARIATDVKDMADAGKVGKIIAHIPSHRRVDALDALCDVEVTMNGVAYLANMDKESADIAVLESNDSKLNEDGTAVILEGGKIGKAPGYRPPDLKPFV